MATLKQRLQSGESLIGTMVTTFSNPDVAKLVQVCGFDYFIVDCEHGSFTYRELANIVAMARGCGIPVLVRVPELKREPILKFMEMGAEGLLLPNTESAEMAEQLVDFSKYAPLGHRGVSLARPHTDFGRVDGPSYIREANETSFLMCQIESRNAVEHIDEILAVNGIDSVLIGPNDMTQDFGILGQFEHPDIDAAFQRVMAAAKAVGKHSGIHLSDGALMKRWQKRGMDMNMWNYDAGLMLEGARSLAALRV